MIDPRDNVESQYFRKHWPNYSEDSYKECAAMLLANAEVHGLTAEEQRQLVSVIASQTSGKLAEIGSQVNLSHHLTSLMNEENAKIHSQNLSITGDAISTAKNNINDADDTFHTTWAQIENQLKLAGCKQEEIKQMHDNYRQQFGNFSKENKDILNMHMDSLPESIRGSSLLSPPNFPSLGGNGGQFPQHLPFESLPKDVLDGIAKIIDSPKGVLSSIGQMIQSGAAGGGSGGGSDSIPLSDEQMHDILNHQNTDDTNSSSHHDDNGDPHEDLHTKEDTVKYQKIPPHTDHETNANVSTTDTSGTTPAAEPELHLSGSEGLPDAGTSTDQGTSATSQASAPALAGSPLFGGGGNFAPISPTSTSFSAGSRSSLPFAASSGSGYRSETTVKPSLNAREVEPTSNETVGSTGFPSDYTPFAQQVVATIGDHCAVGVVSVRGVWEYYYATSTGVDIISDHAYSILGQYPNVSPISVKTPIAFTRSWSGFYDPVQILAASNIPFTTIITQAGTRSPLPHGQADGGGMEDLVGEISSTEDYLSAAKWEHAEDRSDNYSRTFKAFLLMKYTQEVRQGNSGTQYINLLQRL